MSRGLNQYLVRLCMGALLSFNLSTVAAFNIVVNTYSDTVADDGVCSLHEAIVTANNNSDSGAQAGECSGSQFDNSIDQILLPNGFYQLTSALPVITEPLEVFGSRTGQTIIDANGFNRVFYIELDVVLDESVSRFFDFTVANSRSTAGLTNINGPEVVLTRTQWLNNQVGAVLTLSGHLQVANSIFRANQNGLEGGAIRAETAASVTIEFSTFEDNHSAAMGGALGIRGVSSESQTTTALRANTFHGNSADQSGGALYFSNARGLVEHNTITQNVADQDENQDGDAGGIMVGAGAVVQLSSSIVANNIDRTGGVIEGTLRPDISKSAADSSDIQSFGYNFIGNNLGVSEEFPSSASEQSSNANNDIVGSQLQPIDPLLGPLANNGGATKTRLPIKTSQQVSPVIDKGNCFIDIYEQRNYSFRPFDIGPGRPQSPRDYERLQDFPDVPNLNGASCDIGAVELALPSDQLCFPINVGAGRFAAICL